MALKSLYREEETENWFSIPMIKGMWYIDFGFIMLLMMITLFFTLGLLPLCYFQINNFVKGKTTSELYSKGTDQDRETMILNSGIQDDIQVYREPAARVSNNYKQKRPDFLYNT